MKSFNRKITAIVVFTIALVLVMAPPVAAKLQVAITAYDISESTTFFSDVIEDGDPEDASAIINVIDINSPWVTITDLDVQGSFSTSKFAGLSLLTTATSTVTNYRDNTTRVYIAVSDTDFKGPASTAAVASSLEFNNAIGSTMYNSWYDDPLNEQGADYDAADYNDFLANVALLTPGDKIDEYSFLSTNLSQDADAYSNSTIVSDPSQYSMTMVFDFSLTPGGQLTAHSQSMSKNQVVPEFPSLALPAGMVIGLLGAVLLIQRTKEQ